MEHRSRRSWHGLCGLLALLLPLSAAAQDAASEAGDASEDAVDGEASSPEIDPLIPWLDGHFWRSTSLTIPVSRLTRDADGALLVMSEDGAIYRQEGADRWRQVLAGRLQDGQEVDEEGVLLDAESAIEDFTDTTVDESTETNDDGVEIDSSFDVSGSLEDAVEVGIQDADMRVAALQEAQSLWASTLTKGLMLASRPEGSWRSQDNGRTWAPATGLPPSRDFLEFVSQDRRTVILSGTDSGLWFSLDGGQSWREGDSAMRGVGVLSLATDGGIVFAGTTEGLWLSLDGVRWAKLLPPRYADVQMDAVLTDPSWVGGLWVATPEGLLRSDDAGQTFSPAGRNPLVGTKRVVQLPEDNHLLVAGEDGVWETIDGGVRWGALPRGMPGPFVADVVAGVQPAIATRTGVYILSRPVEEAAPEPPPAEGARGLTAETIVGMMLRRTGMDISPLAVQRKFARSALTPKLQLGMVRQADLYIDADYDAISTTRVERSSWLFTAQACFGGCGSSTTDVSYDSGGTFVDYDASSAADEFELVVIGGEIYAASDAVSSIAPAAVNVSQRIAKYRNDLTDYVIELFYSRERLLSERSAIDTLPMMEQVLHDLQIQEVNARLDIYTDGRFTASLDSEQ